MTGAVASSDKPSGGKRSIALLLGVFSVAACILAWIYSNLPHLSPAHSAAVKLPRDIEDAKELGRVISIYKDTHYYSVMGMYFATYIFLQTFAIPGSIFLSILSGFLFSFPINLFLICSCSALGATNCFLLFSILGRKIIVRYFPARVETWNGQVNKHRDNLLNYIIFLRITPFLPNWFINMASPVIGVPIFPFVMGTFIGVGPPSLLAIQAGKTLHTLTSARDAISPLQFVLLIGLGCVSMLPVVFKRYFRQKLE